MSTLEQMKENERRADEIMDDLEALAKKMTGVADRLHKRGKETTQSKLDWMALRFCTRQGDRARTAELLRVVAGHVDLIVEQITGHAEEVGDDGE